MIKVFKLKIILKIILIVAVIGIITALFKRTINVYAKTNNTYKILVDVEDSKLFLFKNDEIIETYKCSGGKWSTPSPIGTWKITFKAKWGEGFGRKFYGIKCSMGTISEFMERKTHIL